MKSSCVEVRGAFALALWTVLSIATRDAEAAKEIIVQDRGNFGVDIGPLDPCIMHPTRLRQRYPCADLDASAGPLPANDGTLAMGIARLGGGVRAIFMVQRSPLADDDGPATVAEAEETLEGMTGALTQNWPGSTSRASNVRSAMLAGGTPAFRGSITTTGAPGAFARFDYQAVIMVRAYTVFVMGPHEASSEMDRVIDQIRLSLPPPPDATPNRDPGDDLGRYASIAGALALVSVLVWHRARRRSRSAR